MGGFRNRFVFPDDVWEEAARKLNGEFVKGRWLADSEIKLLHRNHPITLQTECDVDDNGRKYTRAVPEVALDRKVGMQILPQAEGLLGSITRSLAARTGATIKVSALGEDYHVFGDDEKLANAIFGHHDFVSALKGVAQTPSIVVGQSPNHLLDKDEHFYVSVTGVLKDTHQLIAITEVAKVLLNLLEESNCLE